MADFRVGMVGCGARQGSHVAAFRAAGRCELVAVVDRVDELRAEFAAKHEIPAGYDNVTEMIQAERPDLVTVVTRATWMFRPVMEVLAAGGVKGILLEKPFGVDLEEAQQMLAAAEEAGCKLLVNHQYRFMQPAERMRDILSGGELGEVEFFRSVSSIKLHGQGTHMIDFVRFLNQDKPLAWAQGSFSGGETFDNKQHGPDYDNGILMFADGVPLYVEAGPGSMRLPFPEEKLNCYADAVCTNGRIWFGLNQGLRIWWPDGRFETDPCTWPAVGQPAQVELVRSLYESVEQGTVSRCDASSAIGTQEALCALLASGLEHRKVLFPPELQPGLMERVRAAVGAPAGHA